MDGLTQSALLKALGWSLFDSLWQMALLWLCYILLVSVFSKMTARSRHGLAFLLIGLGGVVFSLSLIVHAYAAVDGPAGGASLSGLLLIAEQPGNAFPEVARQFITQLLPYCSFLYLLALAFLFARYSNHYFHSRRLKLEGLSQVEDALRNFVVQTACHMGIKKEVGVWLSSLVEGPVTLGFLRPVILIPFATVNNLSIEQVEAVLLHELAHIKRYDYLLNLGVTILQIVFFFNPFARQLIQHIKKEREYCCDDLVIQFRYDALDYSSALLSLARTCPRPEALALAATGKNDRLLLQRVKRILKQENAADRPGTRSVVFFLCTVLTGFVILSHPGNPVTRMIHRNRPSVNRVPPKALPSPETFSAALPVYKITSHRGKRSGRTGKLADPKKRPPSYLVERNDPLPDQEILIANKSEYSILQTAVSINIPTSQRNPDMLPVPDANLFLRHREDSSLTGRLLAELTDAESSAREVKIKTLKAIVANETVIRKARAALNSNLRVFREMPSVGYQPEQKLQRQLLEEQIKLQMDDLFLHQVLELRLEKAIRKLSIVYI